MFVVNHPAILALLGLLPLLWWIQARTVRALEARERWWSFGLRCAVVAALVLALAGIEAGRREARTGVVLVVDETASISDAGRAEQAAFVEAVSDLGGPDRVRVVRYSGADGAEGVSGGGLEAAMLRAAAVRPAGYPGRLVLLTDGVSVDPASDFVAARGLGSMGLTADVVPVDEERKPEVALVGLEAPGDLRPGQSFDLVATLRANTNQAVSVRVYRDGVMEAEREVEVAPGATEVVIPNVSAPAGRAVFAAEVSTSADGFVENNRSKLIVEGGRPSRVLVVDPEPNRLARFVAALRLAGFEVDVRPPRAVPASLADLAEFDLVVISDTAHDALGAERVGLVQRWVAELGGGLLLAGGENAFASGGYAGTGLADLSPVGISFEDRAELPVSALLVVLDRSGSMSATVAGKPKMELAAEGAVRAMEALQAKDVFGVMAVDTQIYPILPLGPLGDAVAAGRRVLGIQAGGGGIYVASALLAAFQALEGADARVKHVILFSDAADAEEKVLGEMGTSARSSGLSALDLASAMLAKRITVSVVALGEETDRDTQYLRFLAERGGGRFYLTADAMTLPRIFAEETLRATRASLVEEPTRAVPVVPSEETGGVAWSEAPFLLGYNATSVKPGSRVLLATESGEPLLAMMRMGVGNVAALTTDVKGRWTADWLDWAGFDQLVVQLSRALARGAQQTEGLRVEVRRDGVGARVVVDATDSGGALVDGAKVTVNRTTETEPVAARQVGPGKYEASLVSVVEGESLVVADGSERAAVTVVVPPTENAELAVLQESGPYFAALAELAGGMVGPTPEETLRDTGRTVASTVPLWPWFIAVALVLLPVDLWVRRRDWNRSRADLVLQ